MSFVKVADSESELLSDGEIAVREVDGRKICLSRVDGTWYAFAYKCPHASFGLDVGYIDSSCNVVCPLHNYRFSLKTGRDAGGEGYFLKRWKVVTHGDGVFVEM